MILIISAVPFLFLDHILFFTALLFYTHIRLLKKPIRILYRITVICGASCVCEVPELPQGSEPGFRSQAL